MRNEVTEIKKKLKLAPGVKLQHEIPKDLHHRIHVLAIQDSKRTDKKITIRDKVMEALLIGTEVLEVAERERE